MSTMQVTCPKCGRSFRIPQKFAGRDGECSACHSIFHIPGQSKRADTPDEIVQSPRGPEFYSSVTEEIPAFDLPTRPSDDEFDAPVIEASLSDDSLPVADPGSHVAAVPIESASESLLIAIPLSDDGIDSAIPLAEALNLDDSATDAAEPASQRSTLQSRRQVIPRKPKQSVVETIDDDDVDDELSDEVAPRSSQRPSARSVQARSRSARTVQHVADAQVADQQADRPEPSVDTSEAPQRAARSSARDAGENGRRPDGRSPKQTAIVIGGGVVLLMLAGLYSHFASRTTTAPLPTLEPSPAAADTGRPDRSRPTISTSEQDSTATSETAVETPTPSRVSGGGF